MKKRKNTVDKTSLSESLERDLLEQFGPMLTGDALRKALGYPTMDALRQALFRGVVPVPIFRLANRRGSFALVKDVAKWLANERNSVVSENSKFIKSKKRGD